MIEEFLVLGLIQGFIYALLAMGFSLVYGVGGVLNLSHGGFYLLTAYVFFWNYTSLGVVNTIIISLIMITIIGGVAYLFLIKPLEHTPIGVVIGTFALAFFIEQFVQFVGDAKIHSDIPPLIEGSIEFLGFEIDAHLLLIIIVSLTVIVSLTIFINKSKIGKSIRAVSQDREAATLMGINADRILLYTVMISAFLAGIAAILYIPKDIVAPHKGWSILTNSFAVVVLGGMGSVLGSVAGSFIIAFVGSYCNFYIDPSVSYLVPIIIIVVMLLFRPQGLFGKKELL